MLAIPNITFDGNAEEALNFYAEIFNGKIKNLMRYEDEPTGLDIPDSHKKRIAIAWLFLGNTNNSITICDTLPGEPFTEGNNLKIDLVLGREEIHPTFEALSMGGKVILPLAKTYFSPSFGHVIDKFGTNWYLSVLELPE